MALGLTSGYGSKLNPQETAGFSPCFHLPEFHFGYLFLTHSQVFTCKLVAHEVVTGASSVLLSVLNEMAKELKACPTRPLEKTLVAQLHNCISARSAVDCLIARQGSDCQRGSAMLDF